MQISCGTEVVSIAVFRLRFGRFDPNFALAAMRKQGGKGVKGGIFSLGGVFFGK